MSELKAPRGLPRKPSRLILRALADLKAVERKRATYKIDMGYYHAPFGEPMSGGRTRQKCMVCFAGAVIAQAGNSPGLCIEPSSFSYSTSRKLHALDLFRRGEVDRACCLINCDSGVPNRVVPSYNDAPGQFTLEMTALANELSAEGN
jgi:hypothetical protein